MADDRTGRFDVWLKRAALIVALLVGVTTLFSLARPHLPEDWRWYACSFPFFMAVVGVMFVVGSRQPNTINIPVALAAALFMALDKHGVYAAHVAGRPGATLEYAACCIALAVWAGTLPARPG